MSVPSDIPDGAMQAGPFAQQIGVPETTLRRWVIAGDVETVSRPSAKPGQHERWLTLAGQQQARERAAARRSA
jgi:predicted site-specific integrase-resolvase